MGRGPTDQWLLEGQERDSINAVVAFTKLLIIVQKFDTTRISRYKFSPKLDGMWEKVSEQIRATP